MPLPAPPPLNYLAWRGKSLRVSCDQNKSVSTIFAADKWTIFHCHLIILLLPPAFEVREKVMFSQVSVCLSAGVPQSLALFLGGVSKSLVQGPLGWVFKCKDDGKLVPDGFVGIRCRYCFLFFLFCLILIRKRICSSADSIKSRHINWILVLAAFFSVVFGHFYNKLYVIENDFGWCQLIKFFLFWIRKFI